jgi:hypothetical protein
MITVLNLITSEPALTPRWMRLGFYLSLLCLTFGTACGDDNEDEAQAPPEGCYIEANRLCDCDLDESACTEDVGIWTDGCDSCG